ncbi:hypothetical protein TNCV_3119531 [Trichonephila clavipes]|uniref:Uncharacterized protein n=1 Tax=Trichonephila clavipes TaxID=2585209 RepID=A0A8X6W9J5_TRICX|nr:hypothetical protein TNCV_3119531 [Trichonephila clavipes]
MVDFRFLFAEDGKPTLDTIPFHQYYIPSLNPQRLAHCPRRTARSFVTTQGSYSLFETLDPLSTLLRYKQLSPYFAQVSHLSHTKSESLPSFPPWGR